MRCYKLKVDNTYGPITSAAVGDLQEERRLKADKIVGINTWNEMFN
ncbi:peptidoglycan-binding protein [Bacillus sp. BGMRC 2118]|nr:peptidoglycan-binding protein [Bacillus sp. BGMRC 2118]